jgi:cation diffusion facilitator family transporter
VTRSQTVQRVLIIVLALNLLITVVKLVVGFATGALSVIADGFHSVTDSASNVVGLTALYIAARPPDEDHPYGHRRFETLAAFAIGGMLLLVAWEIVKGIFNHLGEHTLLHITTLDIVIMTATLLVNLGIVTYEARAGRRLGSDLLVADSAHTRTDLYVTLSVIVSLIAARAGYDWVDHLVAAAVAALIVHAAYTILRSTVHVLSDASVLPRGLIEETASSVKGVRHVHRARSRGSSDAAYVDVHVKVDPVMSTTQAHAIASEVERRLKLDVAGVIDAVVHIEPSSRPAPTQWEAVAVRLRAEADAIGVGIHDLHIYEEKSGAYTLELHMEVPANLSLGAAHGLATELESRIKTAVPRVGEITSHIEPLAEAVPDEESPNGPADESLLDQITRLTDAISGAGSAHDVQLHHVDGHLTAAVHITLPAGEPLTRAHALAEDVERRLLTLLPRLKRIVVHVEPPE